VRTLIWSNTFLKSFKRLIKNILKPSGSRHAEDAKIGVSAWGKEAKLNSKSFVKKIDEN
jgi:hypothetical protein